MNSEAPQHFPTDVDIDQALASLPRLREDLAWLAHKVGHSAGGGLTWVHAISEQSSTSTPEHVLFFASRAFLGTATPAPRPFTAVIGTEDDTVTLQYRWLTGDEPNVAPAGAGTVRYQLSHRANGEPFITALDEAPYPPLEEFYA